MYVICDISVGRGLQDLCQAWPGPTDAPDASRGHHDECDPLEQRQHVDHPHRRRFAVRLKNQQLEQISADFGRFRSTGVTGV